MGGFEIKIEKRINLEQIKVEKIVVNDILIDFVTKTILYKQNDEDFILNLNENIESISINKES